MSNDNDRIAAVAEAFKPMADAAGKLLVKGDTVYLPNGMEADFIASVGDGYCVRPMCESEDDDEPTPGDPQIVAQVFRDPPRTKYDGEIAAKRAELEALNKSIREAKLEIGRAKDSREAALAEIGSASALTDMADFLAGRITHYAIKIWGTVRIQTFAEAMKSSFEPERGPRLLSLFGDSKGNLSWQLNAYKDGSGIWFHVVPCRSEEEAKAAAQRMFDEQLKVSSSPSHDLLKSATTLGLTIPPDIAEAVERKRLESVRAGIASLESALAEKRRELGNAVAAAM
jgi:hypothetical protein